MRYYSPLVAAGLVMSVVTSAAPITYDVRSQEYRRSRNADASPSAQAAAEKDDLVDPTLRQRASAEVVQNQSFLERRVEGGAIVEGLLTSLGNFVTKQPKVEGTVLNAIPGAAPAGVPPAARMAEGAAGGAMPGTQLGPGAQLGGNAAAGGDAAVNTARPPRILNTPEASARARSRFAMIKAAVPYLENTRPIVSVFKPKTKPLGKLNGRYVEAAMAKVAIRKGIKPAKPEKKEITTKFKITAAAAAALTGLVAWNMGREHAKSAFTAKTQYDQMQLAAAQQVADNAALADSIEKAARADDKAAGIGDEEEEEE